MPTSPALSQRGVQAASASVGAASTPIQSKQKAEEKSGKKGPTGSNVAYHGDHHCYVIMVHPRGLVIFGGPGASTWRRIEETLPNQRLAGKAPEGERLRGSSDDLGKISGSEADASAGAVSSERDSASGNLAVDAVRRCR